MSAPLRRTSTASALAPIAPQALAQPGASAGAKDFELRLDDCPAGLTRISYRLDPLGGTVDTTRLASVSPRFSRA